MRWVLCPTCPVCYTDPVLIDTGRSAYCDREDCDVISWNPSITAEQNLASASPD